MVILVVDDEAVLRRSVRAHLEDLDHQVVEAGDGAEGLELLRSGFTGLDVVIVDLNMPVMDGYEFIREAVRLAPELPIIVFSGVGLVDDALRAMRLGAWEFVTKPILNFAILDHALVRVQEKARLLRENRAYQENLEELVRQKTTELADARHQIILRLSRAAGFRDCETGGHVMRVGAISMLLAQVLGLPEETCRLLNECAPLHDVGKIGIPDAILLKPGKLDPGQWEIMKRHTLFGCAILGSLEDKRAAEVSCQAIDDLWRTDDCAQIRMARTLALLHHEHWDGGGYPLGLSGEDIPIEVRIVTLVDMFDALSNRRPYKPAYPLEQCRATIRAGSGSHLDPAVVEAFFRNARRIDAIAERWRD